MILYELLAENKMVIAEKWLNAVLSVYHEDGAQFFKRQNDQFANPLGYSARTGLEKVIERLASGKPWELPSELIQFVKLRAVQDFSPSKAIAFVYDLKRIIVEVCGQDLVVANFSEWQGVEAELDKLALQVFELYVADRELIYKVKLQEFKSGNAVVAGGGCPSGAMMKKHNEEKIELKVIRDC